MLGLAPSRLSEAGLEEVLDWMRVYSPPHFLIPKTSRMTPSPIPTLAPTAIQSAQCRQMWQNLGTRKNQGFRLQCFPGSRILASAKRPKREAPGRSDLVWADGSGWCRNKGKESRKLKGKSLWGTGRICSMIFLNRIYPKIYVLKSWILRFWKICLVKCLYLVPNSFLMYVWWARRDCCMKLGALLLSS